MKISGITFLGKPSNYGIIDSVISHSAQPQKEDFTWLKEQGVTDIINFRTMYAPDLDFSEQNIVEELGMKYHNIPSYTRQPNENNINLFLSTIEKVKTEQGKIHMHCKAGADRTGMYAFIYKMLKGIGTLESNRADWMNLGHHFKLYPDLMDWAEEFVKRMLKSSK
ncbi:tyrosine-protein phosphatase [bacterium]|nr:tyrosine-protein phosphatase [bacterium]